MTIADLFNATTDLEWKGKVYRCRPPTGLEQGVFQRWLEQRSLDSIERSNYQTEADRERDRQLHHQNVGVGEYEWGGLLAVKATRTPVGLAKCLQIVLADQGVTDGLAAEIVDHEFRKVAAALASKLTDDPKEVRQIYLGLGLLPPTEPPASPSANSSSGSATPPSTTAWITSADSPTTN